MVRELTQNAGPDQSEMHLHAGVMFACSTLPAYMLAYFISIILQGMGYSVAKSLLLVCAPRLLPLFSAY